MRTDNRFVFPFRWNECLQEILLPVGKSAIATSKASVEKDNEMSKADNFKPAAPLSSLQALEKHGVQAVIITNILVGVDYYDGIRHGKQVLIVVIDLTMTT